MIFPFTKDIIILDYQPKLSQWKEIGEKTEAASLLNLRDVMEETYQETSIEANLANISQFSESKISSLQQQVTVEELERASEEIERLPKPILVHCHGGLRAAFACAAHEAKKRGITSEEEVEKWMSDVGPFDLKSMPRAIEVLKQFLNEKQNVEKKDVKEKKHKNKKDKKKNNKNKNKKKKKEQRK